jgi:hypothetical protein
VRPGIAGMRRLRLGVAEPDVEAISGGIVRLVQQDVASGISQIHSAELCTNLWTLTKFLSRRPIKNTYGEIETPETSGLIRTETMGEHASVVSQGE